MKKIFILLFITIFLISCDDRFNIEQTTYIDSIGIDYKDNNFVVYYHISSSNSLLKENSSNINYSIGKSEKPNLYEAFNELSKSVTGNISLTHIQSIIFSKSFTTYDNLKTFVEVVRTYDYLTPNFYCFYTESPIEEIFSIENPENVSPFFSIINSSDYITTYKLTYFTDLAKSIFEKYYIIKLSMIEANFVWENENTPIVSVIPAGDIYINKDKNKLVMYSKNYLGVSIINHEYTTVVVIEDINFNIYNQKFKIVYKDNKFILKIKGNVYASNLSSSNYKTIINSFNKNIEKEIDIVFKLTQELNMDIFNLENLLYRMNKLNNGFDYKTVELNYEIEYLLLN